MPRTRLDSQNPLDDGTEPFNSPSESSPGLQEILSILANRISDSRPSTTETEPRNDLDVEKFNGRNRSKTRGFLQQCEAAFIYREQYYASDKNKVTFVGSRLTDHALSWYMNVLRNDTLLNNWQSFLDSFLSQFGDPDEKNTAARQLERIRMGPNEDALSYITRFRELRSILNWPDEPLLRPFRLGLSERILNDMAYNRVQPQTLEELMECAREADSRHREYDADRRSTHYSSDTGPRRRNIQRSHRSSSARPASGSDSRRFVKTEQHARPNKPNYLTAGNKLTPEERQRRIDLKLCGYCAKSDHKLSECPLLQGKNPVRSYSAQSSGQNLRHSEKSQVRFEGKPKN